MSAATRRIQRSIRQAKTGSRGTPWGLFRGPKRTKNWRHGDNVRQRVINGRKAP